MRMIKKTALALALVAAPLAAQAKAPLSEVAEIDDNMLWVALAIEISDKCEEIAPRTVKGMFFLNSLKSKAKKMGYSDAEIKAYVKSDAEKARIRTKGEAYVKSKGLNPTDAGDLCKLGHDEIAGQSQIGVLLKAK